MTFDQYQEEALSTAIYPRESGIVYPVLGLTGEAGEVADKVKKTIRDHEGVFSDETRRETYYGILQRWRMNWVYRLMILQKRT